jgi:phosphoserine phosphatase RsbU/P
MLNSESGDGEIEVNGDKYRVSFKGIPVNNWKMAVMLKSDNLYSMLYSTQKNMRGVFRGIQRRVIVIFVVISLLALIILLWIFKKSIVKPIEKLRNKIGLLGEGEFKLKIKEEGVLEIADLAKSFNSLGSELEIYTKRLETEIIHRESIEREIELARIIQENVLPGLEDEFDTDYFSVNAKLIPAKNVSGDFFDAYYITENKLAVVVADVSGKGFPAAFFMAIAHTTIKNICMTEKRNPAKALKKVNDILSDNNKTCMFVTIFLAYYEIHSGKLLYANAGHLPPLLYSEKLLPEKLQTNFNPPLGCLKHFDYSLFEKEIKPGESIIAFTDGVIEAETPDKMQYGSKGLDDFIAKNSSQSCDNVLNDLFDLLIDFQEDKIADDITALILKRKK